MKLEYTDVIVSPMITEKSTELKDGLHSLCFKVHKNANKLLVKEAVEKLFNTKVESVRLMNYYGKEKRYGRFTGRRASWKKAYVKLQKDAKMIEYFEV
jgi:large subunit ribosomal protein L23